MAKLALIDCGGVLCAAILLLSGPLLAAAMSRGGSIIEGDHNSSSTAVVITGLRTRRTHLVTDAISTSLHLLCNRLKESCERFDSAKHSNHNSLSLLLRFTFGKHTIDIYTSGPHDSSNWLTTVNDAGVVQLSFLDDCAPNGDVTSNTQNCEDKSGWKVIGCGDLLYRNSYTKCRLLEVTDSAKVLLRGLLSGHHTADLDPRKGAGIIAWRYYWMNYKVAEQYEVLKVFVEDVLQASHVVLQAVFEFATTVRTDKRLVEAILHAVKDYIQDVSIEQPVPATQQTKEVDSVISLLPDVTLGLDATIPQHQLDAVAQKGLIILTQSNCGYLDFAENWIINMRKINQTNFLVIAEDEITYNFLSIQYGAKHVVKLRCVAQASQASIYNHPDFNVLTASRPAYLNAVLRGGYSVLWMDTDTYTFEFPMKFVPPEYDVATMDDEWKFVEGETIPENICSCLMFLRPSGYAMQLVQEFARGFLLLYVADQNKPAQDQQVWSWVGKRYHTGLTGKMFFFPLSGFPNGGAWFLSNRYNEAFPDHQPAWVHANWMQGRQTKIDALNNKQLWLAKTDLLPVCHEKKEE